MKRWITTLGLLAILLVLGACGRDSSSSADPTPEAETLRVYTVPPERAETVRVALLTVLGDQGSVSLAPPDKLLVLTHQALQSAVAETLGSLIEAKPKAEAPADPDPVRLTLWVVDVTESANADPRLQPLAATLDAIRATVAAPGFALSSQLSLTTSSSKHGSSSVQDKNVQLNVRVVADRSDGVDAELNIVAGRMAANTETRLKFGEIVALAQATPEDDGQSRVRLILIRVDPAS